jgi:hypothetical protein
MPKLETSCNIIEELMNIHASLFVGQTFKGIWNGFVIVLKEVIKHFVEAW